MNLSDVTTSTNVEYATQYNPSSIDFPYEEMFMSTPEMIFLFGLTALFFLAIIAFCMLAFLVGKVIVMNQDARSDLAKAQRTYHDESGNPYWLNPTR